MTSTGGKPGPGMAASFPNSIRLREGPVTVALSIKVSTRMLGRVTVSPERQQTSETRDADSLPRQFRQYTRHLRGARLRRCWRACRFHGLVYVLHYHPRRIAHGHRVGRNVVDDHAVHADDGAFPDGYTFHDERVLPDPGVAPDAHRLDLVHRSGKIGDTRHGFAGVGVTIHKPDARSNIHLILNHDLFVHHEHNIVANVHAVAKHQPGFIALAPAENADFAEKIDVVPNYYAGVPHHERHAPDAEVLPHRDTSAAKQRFIEEVAQEPAQSLYEHLLRVESEPQQGVEKSRQRQSTRHDAASGVAQPAIEGGLAPPDFKPHRAHR